MFGELSDQARTERDAERATEQVKAAAEQAGDRLADGWLTTKIQAQFFADDDIKSRFLNVSTRDGVVKLKGFVESDDARRQVLEIARNTDGVKEVDDRQLLIGSNDRRGFRGCRSGAHRRCPGGQRDPGEVLPGSVHQASAHRGAVDERRRHGERADRQ